MHGVCSSPAAALAGDSLPEYVVLLHAMDSNTHPLASARDCSPPGQCVVTCKPSLCHRTGAWLISRTRMSLQTRIGSACTFQAKITNTSAHDSRALTAAYASLWKYYVENGRILHMRRTNIRSLKDSASSWQRLCLDCPANRGAVQRTVSFCETWRI
jgi:hypothetical protein